MIKTEIVSTRARCALESRYDVKHTPAVVRWDAGPLGVDYLCKRCLDDSLDFADDMRVGEPHTLTWVMTEAQRWCAGHDWPAVMCSTWLHGPGANPFGQVDMPTSSRWPGPFGTKLSDVVTIEGWQVGMATPEHPCWCARPTCTGCAPAGGF